MELWFSLIIGHQLQMGPIVHGVTKSPARLNTHTPMPNSGISGIYDSLIPSFLRNLHTVLHIGCINLHSHPKCKRVLFSPHPLQCLLLVDFFDDGHSELTLCSFDFLSLIMSNVEHLFTCLLANWLSTLEKCLFRSSTQFE